MRSKFTKFWAMLVNEKRAIWYEYSALALLILLPLLLPGYILTLDLVFTPTFTWPTSATNTYPLEVLLFLLHYILPGDVIEKIILFLILLLSGVGMHMLLRSVNNKGTIAPEVWRISQYFGGILYMINPFTYSRFMAGQWMVLLGYALLPFFVRALLNFLALPGWKSAACVTVWAFLIMTVSVHAIGIIAFLGLLVPIVACIFKYWRNGRHIKRYIGWSGICVAMLAVLSSFWLIPAVMGKGDIGRALGQFDQSHFSAFETIGSGTVEAFGEVIRLQGFWVEARQLYLLPQDLTPAWGLVFLLIWLLVIYGGIKAWRTHRMLVGIALGCIIVGSIIAATSLIAWASQYIPVMSGYREPHKFISLVVLGYCMLGVFGMANLVTKVTQRFGETGGQIFIIVCLLLPLAVTPTMLWGFNGQLSPRQYPVSWYEMNQTLKELPGHKRILFLPWHQYAEYGFSGRLIANPADKFFEAPVVISNDPEFRDISPTVPDEEKSSITAALKHPDKLARELQALGINYILLAKESDKTDYSDLDKVSNIKIVSENEGLRLYRLEL